MYIYLYVYVVKLGLCYIFSSVLLFHLTLPHKNVSMVSWARLVSTWKAETGDSSSRSARVT
jgi:hypothetical protein